MSVCLSDSASILQSAALTQSAVTGQSAAGGTHLLCVGTGQHCEEIYQEDGVTKVPWWGGEHGGCIEDALHSTGWDLD